MRKHSIWGEAFDVLIKGENDQGRPFTRVSCYAARAAVEGFIVLTLAEVVQCTNDGTERVSSVTTNVQYVEDLPTSVMPPPADEAPEPEPAPTEEPDGFDDVREALAIARDDSRPTGERLANVGHVLGRMPEDSALELPEDLAGIDRAELNALAESLSGAAADSGGTDTPVGATDADPTGANAGDSAGNGAEGGGN